MREVDFPVRDIVIPAGNDRLFAVQLLQIVRIFLIPYLSFLQTAEPVSGVGGVDGVEIEVRELECNQPAFKIHGVRSADFRVVSPDVESGSEQDHGAGVSLAGGAVRAGPCKVVFREKVF